VLSENPASKISSSESEGFRLISRCIHEQFPEAVIAPYLVVGGTDAKMLEPLAEGVYRFTPYRISKDELAGMHGVNERVSIENLEKAVRFYASLIMNI
jgi:carboxypeptidase PM20D1